MVDLFSRAFSNYLKGLRLENRQIEYFLDVVFCLLCIQRGNVECLQLNPVPLSPQYFITFIILLAIKYCFKDRGGADVLCFPTL